MPTNPYSPPGARVSDVLSNGAAPALWNPSAAVNWSLLFSPAFGAYLHMKNWQALGETKKASASMLWMVTVVVVVLLAALAGMFLPSTKLLDAASRGAGLGLLVVWYVVSGRTQVDLVKVRFGEYYPRRSWGMPILFAFLAWFGFFAVIMGAAFLFFS